MNELELLEACKKIKDLPPIANKWNDFWSVQSDNVKALYPTGDSLRVFYKNHGYKLDLIPNGIPTTQTITTSQRVVDKKLVDIKTIRTTRKVPKAQPVDHKRIFEELYKDLPHFKPLDIKYEKGEHTLILTVTDPHIGKLELDGSGLNRDMIVEQLFIRALKKVEHLKVKKIVLAFLGDIFHYDNVEKSTAKRTRQDAIMQADKMWEKVDRLAVTIINMCEQVAKTDVYIVAGNHDDYSTHGLFRMLKHAYKLSKNVSIKNGNHYRKYCTVGNIGFGFTHQIKKDKAIDCMMTEAREIVGKTKQFVWVTAHLHHELVQGDFGSYTVYVMPPLCGEGWWSNQEGYKGRVLLKGLAVNSNNEIDTFTAKEV